MVVPSALDVRLFLILIRVLQLCGTYCIVQAILPVSLLHVSLITTRLLDDVLMLDKCRTRWPSIQQYFDVILKQHYTSMWNTAPQKRNVVTAYLKSKELQRLGITRQNACTHTLPLFCVTCLREKLTKYNYYSY